MSKYEDRPPTREETIEMLRGWVQLPARRAEWNAMRARWQGVRLDLSGARLAGSDLHEADFSNVSLDGADLTAANLERACLTEAGMCGTVLRYASLVEANCAEASLIESNLREANLNRASLQGANLAEASLVKASLKRADLFRANLRQTDLSKADLHQANLEGANLFRATCWRTDFSGAILTRANLHSTDLHKAIMEGIAITHATLGATLVGGLVAGVRDVQSLANCEHAEPSHVDTQTLKAGKGRIPDTFLRGCGLEAWEVEMARLYDPLLQGNAFAEQLNRIFDMRVKGPIGGVFISYCHADEAFIDILQPAIYAKDINVWRDVHDMVAGPMARQVLDAIRRNDIVLLVLSVASVNSDWVEFEMETARDREKKEGRAVLCPIAIDEAWKRVRDERPNFAKLARKYNIIAFDPAARIESGPNAAAFDKLIRGMKLFYGDGASDYL